MSSGIKHFIQALTVVAITILAVIGGYRWWAVNSWLEYRPVCWDEGYYIGLHLEEVVSPLRPEVAAAVRLTATRLGGRNSEWAHLYRVDGNRLFIRSGLYVNGFHMWTKETRFYYQVATGSSGKNSDGENICRRLRPLVLDPDHFETEPIWSYFFYDEFDDLLWALTPQLSKPQE